MSEGEKRERRLMAWVRLVLREEYGGWGEDWLPESIASGEHPADRILPATETPQAKAT